MAFRVWLFGGEVCLLLNLELWNGLGEFRSLGISSVDLVPFLESIIKEDSFSLAVAMAVTLLNYFQLGVEVLRLRLCIYNLASRIFF